MLPEAKMHFQVHFLQSSLKALETAPAGTPLPCVCLSWLNVAGWFFQRDQPPFSCLMFRKCPHPHVLPRSVHWKQLRSWSALPKMEPCLHRYTLGLLHISTKRKSKPHRVGWLKNSELQIATHIFLSTLRTLHSSFRFQTIFLFFLLGLAMNCLRCLLPLHRGIR